MEVIHTEDSFMFELIMEPFGWTIRNELLSDNLDQIHQYLSQYVKHTSIELIVRDNNFKKSIYLQRIKKLKSGTRRT